MAAEQDNGDCSPQQPQWGRPEATPTVRFFHERIRRLVAERLAAARGSREALVGAGTLELLGAQDLERMEAELLASGHRFEFSATISQRESPDKYKAKAGAQAGAEVAADALGRQVVGTGDNLIQRAKTLVGIARFVATVEQVTDMLINGVPADTVAVIDDSGGTLTAPILEQFAGVVCLGGTVRSHLGILSREYGIPCLMNAKLEASLRHGDRVEVEYTAAAASAEDFQSGKGVRARVWKLPAQAAS